MIDHCPSCHGASISPLVPQKNGYSFVECNNCSLIFVDPMPSDETLSAFYDNYHKSDQYLSKLDSKIRRAKKRIRLVNGLKRRGTFIDVGCNVGFAVEAARLLGFDAHGIDIDTNAIEVARGQFGQAKFEVRSVQNMAESDEKFDFIYCSEVIEHLPELDSFFAALVKCLSKDGVLYITTPDNGHFSLPKEFSKLVDWTSVRPPEHLMYFSRPSVVPVLRRHGLDSVKMPFSFKPTLKIIAKVKS